MEGVVPTHSKEVESQDLLRTVPGSRGGRGHSESSSVPGHKPAGDRAG